MPSQQDVSGFIQASLRSVWALEVLCFLRENRERKVAQEEIVAGLRGSALVVTQSVDSLVAAGLVAAEKDGAVRYRPASRRLDALVEGTIALYARSPDAVRRMIVQAVDSLVPPHLPDAGIIPLGVCEPAFVDCCFSDPEGCKGRVAHGGVLKVADALG